MLLLYVVASNPLGMGFPLMGDGMCILVLLVIFQLNNVELECVLASSAVWKANII